MKHFYIGSHNVWYGETMHDCNCGFSDHDKQKVLDHIDKEGARLSQTVPPKGELSNDPTHRLSCAERSWLVQ